MFMLACVTYYLQKNIEGSLAVDFGSAYYNFFIYISLWYAV